MKKIWYLTKSEFKRLKKSFIIIAVIITIFLAALLGIVSVETDMMRNLCNHLDTLADSFDLSLYEGTFDIAAAECDGLIYSPQNFFDESDIIGADGTVFEMQQEIEKDGDKYIYYYSNSLYYLNEVAKLHIPEYYNVIEGRLMENDYEICLFRYAYESLGASIGDTVTIADVEFEVVGEIEWKDVENTGYTPSYAYFATVGSDIQLYWISMKFDTSAEMFAAARHLKARGFDVRPDFSWYYENITEVQAALTAVVVMLGIVITVTLYSLISMIFRQRKTHICRLKILGATNRDVIAVYCGIIVVLLLCVVIVATALGIAFNLYFMDLCEQLLEFEFTARFNVYAPFIAFGAFCGVTYVLWLIVNRKTKASLAEEIRYE